MARRYLQRPAILVDPRMGRVRIYQFTLHSIGDPSYIILIVNPNGRSITIMRSEKSDQRACFLKRTQYDKRRSPEIFSRALVRDLFALNEMWDINQPYRVFGETSSDKNAITFKLVNSELFLGEKEWQYEVHTGNR